MEMFAPYSPCAGRNFPKSTTNNAATSHFGTAHLFGLTSAMKYVGGEDKWAAQMRYQTCGRKKIWGANIKELMEAFAKADPDAAQSFPSACAAFGQLDVKMADRCKDHGLSLHVAIAEEGDIVYTPSGWLLAEETLNSKMVLGIKVAVLQEGKSLDAMAIVRNMKAKEDANAAVLNYMDAYVKLAEAIDSEKDQAAADTVDKKQQAKLDKEKAISAAAKEKNVQVAKAKVKAG